MKKIIFFFCLILALSCNKDNQGIFKSDEKNVVQIYKDQQVIGKWMYDSVAINGVKKAYEHHPGCKKDYFYFVNRPGQDHQYVENLFRYDNCATISTDMDWRLSGEYLILNFGPQEFKYKILRLTLSNFDVAVKQNINGVIQDVQIYAKRMPCDGSVECQE